MILNEEEIITKYKSGMSMTELAKTYNTYAASIKRLLEKNHIELRHDFPKKGELYVKDGDKLLNWARGQKRLVTRAELASVIGKKRLSNSYFIKYPELGTYVKPREQTELKSYSQILYDWLKENNIPYKPKDKKAIGVTVDALLLNKYSNIVLQITEKPKYISRKKHDEMMENKRNNATIHEFNIIFLNKEDILHLDTLKLKLDDIINIKGR